MGDGGNFERTFCCYGKDVDCAHCGAYGVFNAAYHVRQRDRGSERRLYYARHTFSKRSSSERS